MRTSHWIWLKPSEFKSSAQYATNDNFQFKMIIMLFKHWAYYEPNLMIRVRQKLTPHLTPWLNIQILGLIKLNYNFVTTIKTCQLIDKSFNYRFPWINVPFTYKSDLHLWLSPSRLYAYVSVRIYRRNIFDRQRERVRERDSGIKTFHNAYHRQYVEEKRKIIDGIALSPYENWC